GGEHHCAAQGGGERRQAQARAELEHARAGEILLRNDSGEGDPARPQLRPVRHELVLVERLLVDEVVGARRPEQCQLSPGELEGLLDQSAAKRSTGTPSGSASWA